MTRAALPAGFGALWCAVAVDAIGFGIVIPILPIYAVELNASPMVAGLLLASFSLAQLVTAPRWGRLSDRIGRRPALIASVGGTAIGAALTAVAPTVAVLFLGRIVDGASGGSLAVAQAAAGDLAEGPDRTRILGLLGARSASGSSPAPRSAGWLRSSVPARRSSSPPPSPPSTRSSSVAVCRRPDARAVRSSAAAEEAHGRWPAPGDC